MGLGGSIKRSLGLVDFQRDGVRVDIPYLGFLIGSIPDDKEGNDY